VGEAHGINKKNQTTTKWLNNIILYLAAFGAGIVGSFHPWASPTVIQIKPFQGFTLYFKIISTINSHNQ